MTDRKFDGYEFSTINQQELIDEVLLMEQNSEWRSGIISKELTLEAIEAPLYALDAASRYGMDSEAFVDTAEQTKLLLAYGMEKMLVRDTARSSLCETAKLFGSALGRMGAPLLAETLNNGLSVARGNSLILMRYGKASAVHSDADGGYQIMPIPELMDVSIETLSSYLGTLDFKAGYNSHGYTTAMWELPDVQQQILDIYQDALQGAVSRNFAINMMPAVRFSTSDTASSCACLTPVFVTGNAEFRFVDGIQIRHSKRFRRGGVSGMDAFKLGASEMYSQFTSCAEVISKLSHIAIQNGCNCVVSLCKRYSIPKKYGDAARILVEGFTQGGRRISAHDVYLCMTEAVAEAQRCKASWVQINDLQEKIAKIPNADWSAHDVSGLVAWSD